MTGERPQPGWYDIGDGIERRHDGQAWTNERRHTTGQPAAPIASTSGTAPAATPPKTGCGSGCLIFVVALVALGVIGVLVGGSGDDDGSSDAGLAEYACETQVKENLKSPSTADFVGTNATGTGPFTVTGEVDSQNGFGAMVRSSFECSVRIADGNAHTTVNYVR